MHRACNTLYLSDDTPADIRLRRMLNTSCYVPRRMRAARVCESIWKDTIILLRPARKEGMLNKGYVESRRGGGGERGTNENAKETACPDHLDFGIDRF